MIITTSLAYQQRTYVQNYHQEYFHLFVFDAVDNGNLPAREKKSDREEKTTEDRIYIQEEERHLKGNKFPIRRRFRFK